MLAPVDSTDYQWDVHLQFLIAGPWWLRWLLRSACGLSQIVKWHDHPSGCPIPKPKNPFPLPYILSALHPNYSGNLSLLFTAILNSVLPFSLLLFLLCCIPSGHSLRKLPEISAPCLKTYKNLLLHLEQRPPSSPWPSWPSLIWALFTSLTHPLLLSLVHISQLHGPL